MQSPSQASIDSGLSDEYLTRGLNPCTEDEPQEPPPDPCTPENSTYREFPNVPGAPVKATPAPPSSPRNDTLEPKKLVFDSASVCRNC